MQKVFVLVGIPASGKSTWAKKMLADEPDKWKRVNRDDLRTCIDNSVWSSQNEKMIVKVQNYIILEALKNEKTSSSITLI